MGNSPARPAAAAPARNLEQNRPAPQRAAQTQPAARADAFRGVDAGRQSIDRGRASAAAASRPNVGHGGGRPGGGGGGGRMHGRG